MNKITHINNKQELRHYINSEGIRSALLGNGFSCSHPKQGKTFEFDFEAVKKHIPNSQATSISADAKNCPEKLLRNTGKHISPEIIMSYIENFSPEKDRLFDHYETHGFSARRFLRMFQRIYTLNYDPVMYFEFLRSYDLYKKGEIFLKENTSASIDWRSFPCFWQNDGFRKNGTVLSQDDLVSNLKNEDQVMLYMHGSYFIHIDYQTSALKKLGRHEISKTYIKESLQSSLKMPFFILEPSWEEKKAQIDQHPYLDYCYQDLCSRDIENILVFGVSFSNDNHILQALKNNTKLKAIHIVCRGEDGQKAIEGRIKMLLSGDERFKYIVIDPNENYLWDLEDTLAEDLQTAVETGFDNWHYSLSDSRSPSSAQAEYDEWSSHLRELVLFIEGCTSYKDFEKDLMCYELAYDCIHEQIIRTELINKFGDLNDLQEYEKFKTRLLNALSNLMDDRDGYDPYKY